MSKPAINKTVSLTCVSDVILNTKGKDLVARRVQKSIVHIQESAIRENVTLICVTIVQTHTKKKEFTVQRVYRHEEIVISPAEMSGWRGSIRSAPVDAQTGESSVQPIRMGTISVITSGGHLTVDPKRWRLRSSARHPSAATATGKQKSAATEDGFARRRNGARRVRFVDLWTIPACTSSIMSTRVRRSLTSVEQKQKRRF